MAGDCLRRLRFFYVTSRGECLFLRNYGKEISQIRESKTCKEKCIRKKSCLAQKERRPCQ